MSKGYCFVFIIEVVIVDVITKTGQKLTTILI